MFFRKEKWYEAKFNSLVLTKSDYENFRRILNDSVEKFAERDILDIPYRFFHDHEVYERDSVVLGNAEIYIKIAELGYGTSLQNLVAKICSVFNISFQGKVTIKYIDRAG